MQTDKSIDRSINQSINQWRGKGKRMRKRKRSRQRPLKRGCFAFGTSCHLGWKLGSGAGFVEILKGSKTRNFWARHPRCGSIVGAQRPEFTEQPAHLYCTSLSIKHITDPNKAFQWSPIMTIHSIDLLQLHSWYAIVLDRFTLFSPPGFLFVCLKSSVSFSCFLIIKYSKYIS